MADGDPSRPAARAAATRQPSAGYALRLRVVLTNVPGTLGRLTTAIGRAGGDIDAVDIVEHRDRQLVRDLIVKCRDVEHGRSVVGAVRRVPAVRLEAVSDRTFDLHRGGKIEVAPRFALDSRDLLSMAYTPGVGRVAHAIAEHRELVWDLTIKRNSVAILTNGSAVLGLGDIGPEAAMPVMEGKAMLFKEFAGIDAYPICARAADADTLVRVAAAIAPGFGGINLEDIAAPLCFEVERRLLETLDIPVFHDDQHGTAVVVLAALLNAARVVGKRLAEMTVTVIGMGAAGVACSRLLLAAGVGDVVGVDRAGILDPAAGLAGEQLQVARLTNRDGRRGQAADALRGADAFVGVSGPGTVPPEWIAGMAEDAIVFALANPIPEIMPEEMPGNVRVVATGRSDYPNQINNVLVFPGFFRGLLDARAHTVDEAMKLAAARELAALVGDEQRNADYVIPSVLDRRVAATVAASVRAAAEAAGVTRPPAAPVALSDAAGSHV